MAGNPRRVQSDHDGGIRRPQPTSVFQRLGKGGPTRQDRGKRGSIHPVGAGDHHALGLKEADAAGGVELGAAGQYRVNWTPLSLRGRGVSETGRLPAPCRTGRPADLAGVVQGDALDARQRVAVRQAGGTSTDSRVHLLAVGRT